MDLIKLRKEVLSILSYRDISGRELIQKFGSQIECDYKRYNLENPASAGNFIHNEVMAELGVPVYKRRVKDVLANRTLTMYSLRIRKNRSLCRSNRVISRKKRGDNGERNLRRC